MRQTLALLACTSLLLGCGSNQDADTSRSEAAASAVPTSRPRDDSIQTWGHEATLTLGRRLSAVVQDYLDARATRDWPVVCSRMADRQRAEQGALAGGVSCARAIESFAEGADRATLRREAEIKTLSVRIGPHGGRLYAFVIYHRPDGVWATALVRETGQWKVVTVTPEPLS